MMPQFVFNHLPRRKEDNLYWAMGNSPYFENSFLVNIPDFFVCFFSYKQFHVKIEIQLYTPVYSYEIWGTMVSMPFKLSFYNECICVYKFLVQWSQITINYSINYILIHFFLELSLINWSTHLTLSKSYWRLVSRATLDNIRQFFSNSYILFLPLKCS